MYAYNLSVSLLFVSKLITKVNAPDAVYSCFILPVMRHILLINLLILSVVVSLAQDTTQKIVAGRQNSVKHYSSPYVILISIDGFRHDYAKKYNARNILRLATGGVMADGMIPSFPSLTFPNHYTIVTGLYPIHHGLIDNSMYNVQTKKRYGMTNAVAVGDSSWYGGYPLWSLAEKNKMLTASFFWVGSEAATAGVRPTYYYIYNTKIPMDRRLQTVKDWLSLPEGSRPHFISFYFPEVDHEAHNHGVNSKETEEAVHLVDEAIGKMVEEVSATGLAVNFIVVSDHGMTDVDFKNTMRPPSSIDTSKVVMVPGEAIIQLHVKEKTDILRQYKMIKDSAKDFDVYLIDSMPARWHYNRSEDRYGRTADIILVPHWPKIFNYRGAVTTPGKHGYDPAMQDMHASFFAWGPAFKQGYTIPEFENIHVYPLVAEILGLKYRKKKIDGRLNVLKQVLQKKR